MPSDARACGAALAAIASGLMMSACGAGGATAAATPRPSFRVAVVRATFPGTQRLAQRTRLVISVRNTGEPDDSEHRRDDHQPQVGNGGEGVLHRDRTPARIGEPLAASLDHRSAAGRLPAGCGSGGPGGAETAYANTWALGALRPGAPRGSSGT